MQIEEYTVEALISYLMRDHTMSTYGLRGISMFKKEETNKVKTMAVKLDPKSYSGLHIQINREWFNKQFIENPSLIEEMCRFHLLRIVNQHFVELVTNANFGEKNWEKTGSLASQIAAVSQLKNYIPNAAKVVNVTPSSFKYDEGLTMEDYLIKLIQEDTDTVDAGMDASGIGEEDFSEATSDKNAMQSKLKLTTIATSEAMLKECGNLPQELREIIEGNLQPNYNVPWTQLFNRRVSDSVTASFTASPKRVDKRKLALLGPHTGLTLKDFILMPGASPDCGPTVGILIDESGSMSDEDVKDILEIVLGVKHRVPGTKVFVIPFDAEVHNLYEINKPSDVKPTRDAYGGTDIGKAMSWALGEYAHETLGTFEHKITTMVIATDGYGPALDSVPGNITVIWLLTEKEIPYTPGGGKVDYGHMVHIND